MYLFMIVAMAMAIALALTNPAVTAQRNDLMQQRVLAGQFLNFVRAAHLYVQANPAPSTKTFYTWAQIRNTPGVPPATLDATYPDHWKLVRTATDWAVCADLPEHTLAILKTMAPGDITLEPVTATGAWAKYYLGEAASKATYQTLCNP